MTRDEYEVAICKRLSVGRVVVFRNVHGMVENSCHHNVNLWVKENRKYTAVRGWVVHNPTAYRSGKIMIQLAAYSVVRDQNGNLFDITPMQGERARSSMRFVEHLGDPKCFWEFEKVDRFIFCETCTD